MNNLISIINRIIMDIKNMVGILTFSYAKATSGAYCFNGMGCGCGDEDDCDSDGDCEGGKKSDDDDDDDYGDGSEE